MKSPLALLLNDEVTAWQVDGLCTQTDPEVFFPEKGGSPREAKRTCMACTVRTECLQYALDNDERWGVWGGLSERERNRLKRQQRADQAAEQAPEHDEAEPHATPGAA